MAGGLTRRALLGALLMSAPAAGACRLDHRLLARLELLERQLGRRLFRTSTCRTPAHNDAVGGVPGSEHLTGHAVDVVCDTSQARYQVLSVALPLFERIGIGRTFLHLGVSTSHPQRVVWLDRSALP